MKSPARTKYYCVCLITILHLLPLHSKSQNHHTIAVWINVQEPFYYEKSSNSYQPRFIRSNTARDKKFNDVFQFYQNELQNPKAAIKHYCDSFFTENKYEVLFPEDDLHDYIEELSTDNEAIKFHLEPLAEKYKVDTIIVISVDYGFLLEKTWYINVGNGSYIDCHIDYINAAKNQVIYNDRVEKFKQTPKWNQPPHYPTVISTYNELLSEKLLPTFWKKLANFTKTK